MEQVITIINREISDHERYLSFYKSKGNKQCQWEEERIITVLKGIIKRSRHGKAPGCHQELIQTTGAIVTLASLL